MQAAVTRLDATAQSSSNAANQSAYTAYLAASAEQRAALLERVTVIDVAPTVDDLDGELRREVFWAVNKEHHAAFLDRLEGWWLRRVLKQLCSSNGDRIGSVEVEAQMSDLREGFKQESLPIDDDLLEGGLPCSATRVASAHTGEAREIPERPWPRGWRATRLLVGESSRPAHSSSPSSPKRHSCLGEFTVSSRSSGGRCSAQTLGERRFGSRCAVRATKYARPPRRPSSWAGGSLMLAPPQRSLL